MASSATAQTTARPVNVRQVHYQIAMMERVLEGAVEHGATIIRDRLQAIAPDAPAQMLILDNPRVRGFRLDSYGVFFDVEVPSLNGTLTWSLRTLDQKRSGPAERAQRAEGAAGSGRRRSAAGPQACRAAGRTVGAGSRSGSGRAASSEAAESTPGVRFGGKRRGPAGRCDSTRTGTAAAQQDDRILENPNEAYREEVVQALVDAMLDHSGALGIDDDEWLTIAARGIQDQPRLGPPDNDAQTVMMRLRGVDLAAFRANRISRDEVIKRIDRRVF